MSLTFPRSFPDLCVPVSGVTDIQRSQLSSRNGEGGLSNIDVAPAVIRSDYSITARGRDAVAQWKAFFASLRGAARSFKGVPIRDGVKFYRWPLSRPRGFTGLLVSGVQWDGTGNVTDIGAGKDTISLDGMPNGLVLSYGDWISYVFGGVSRMHMVLEGGTVSGNAVTLTVEPVIRQDVTLDDPVTVQFESPYADMTVSGQVSESGTKTATTFSFLAYAKLR